MKKTLLIVIFNFFFLLKSQCNLSSLTLDLLGKEYYEVSNILYSDINISDLKINFFNPAEKKVADYDANFEYLNEKHYKKYIQFNYVLPKCFTNSNQNDYVEYSLKLIDDKVYKVSISKTYSFDEKINLQKDLERLKKMIKEKYPVFNGKDNISYRFNITKENPEGEYIQTGTNEKFSATKLNSNTKIWKVNSCDIITETEYSYGKIGGYSLPAKNLKLQFEFTNLKNTVLDNRGY
ncbi:hypothetical protein [Chryseobacterium sp. R2A-55]|uniref:hypothetical protein n=1 Tax=Chryseobacterium sp. R2A-55 TaxID=2744445 RepID=UPI001F469DE6|nr:hypothetical protein [Chryseobacterium sp. R2A-55]